MDVGIAAAWLIEAIFTGGLIPNWITAITYLVLSIWYISTSSRRQQLPSLIKILSAMALMLWFFKLYMYFIILLPPYTSKGIIKSFKILQLLGNEFSIMFLTTFILSPIIISIYREKYTLMGFFIFAPAFIFSTVMAAFSLKEISYIIGCPSAHYLGFVAALHIAALIIGPVIRLAKQRESGCPRYETSLT